MFYRHTNTGDVRTRGQWLNGIAFHNYCKGWRDCNHDEKVWVLALFKNWCKRGKLEVAYN